MLFSNDASGEYTVRLPVLCVRLNQGRGVSA